jgi:hypothetical protein
VKSPLLNSDLESGFSFWKVGRIACCIICICNCYYDFKGTTELVKFKARCRFHNPARLAGEAEDQKWSSAQESSNRKKVGNLRPYNWFTQSKVSKLFNIFLILEEDAEILLI